MPSGRLFPTFLVHVVVAGLCSWWIMSNTRRGHSVHTSLSWVAVESSVSRVPHFQPVFRSDDRVGYRPRQVWILWEKLKVRSEYTASTFPTPWGVSRIQYPSMLKFGLVGF